MASDPPPQWPEVKGREGERGRGQSAPLALLCCQDGVIASISRKKLRQWQKNQWETNSWRQERKVTEEMRWDRKGVVRERLSDSQERRNKYMETGKESDVTNEKWNRVNERMAWLESNRKEMRERINGNSEVNWQSKWQEVKYKEITRKKQERKTDTKKKTQRE